MDWNGILGFAIALGIISLAGWGTPILIGFLTPSQKIAEVK